MKLSITYVYPAGINDYDAKADRFIESYRRNPPGLDHETIVVCNGFSSFAAVQSKFSRLPNVRVLDHDNRGMDIGGYLVAAKDSKSDLMVFFGAHSYFRKPEWMTPVLRSWLRNGDTLYGATGHRGEGHVHPHIRTTGFWMRPGLLTEYCPNGINSDRRYEFEHGATCLTSWIKNRGKTPWVVTWESEHHVHHSHGIPGGYHNGDQYNVIFGDKHTEPDALMNGNPVD